MLHTTQATSNSYNSLHTCDCLTNYWVLNITPKQLFLLTLNYPSVLWLLNWPNVWKAQKYLFYIS